MKFEQQKSDSMRIFAADFGMNGLPVNSGIRGIPEEKTKPFNQLNLNFNYGNYQKFYAF